MTSMAAGTTPELSAVVLCYRAGESILDLLAPLRASLDELAVPYELILVANYWPGRRDYTPDVVRSYGAQHENVVVLAHPKEGAMGWDMRAGLAAARGDYVVVIDGDLQNPPGDVARIYREIKQTGVGVMKGRRVARRDGFKRQILTIGYNALFLLMFDTKGLWDINGKPKAISRAALEKMTLKSDDWFIDAEIILEARRLGLTIAEMPVVFEENSQRDSFVRLGAVLEFLRNMLRRRFHPSE
jgi:glycosyltransferase involved in cell wall biosynthesis